MEMQGRYIVAQANLADRRAEAARARLVKGDSATEAQPTVMAGTIGTTGVLAGLRARLGSLRPAVRRPAASSAR